MKRLRIKCAIDLIAYRFTISSSYNSDAKINFFAALNSIPGLFGDDDAVMRQLRDFREHKGSRKDDALIDLIKITAKKSGVPLVNVSDIDLARPFSI